MRIHILLLVSLFLFSGCSTVHSVFGGGQSEDYNKLTYGDPHANWGGRTPVETPHDGQAVTAADDSGVQRNTASVSETGQSEALDPTDDQVRGKIETDRGAYVSQYARGDRATKADFLDRALGDGSLWTSENDSNYFYTKTKMRAMGEIISIQVEYEKMKQIGDEIKNGL